MIFEETSCVSTLVDLKDSLLAFTSQFFSLTTMKFYYHIFLSDTYVQKIKSYNKTLLNEPLSYNHGQKLYGQLRKTALSLTP